VRVTEVLKQATELLQDSGVEDVDVNTQWLMSYVLGCSRSELALKLPDLLSDEEQARWDEAVAKRIQRIPLQHIIGTVDFCGIELDVNEHVLIPRQETELLAEMAWVTATSMNQASVLDIGTGSGCLAISIALNAKDSAVHALDICPKALKVARANASRHGLKKRITFHEADMRRPLPLVREWDLIVTNPPYVPSRDIKDLEPEVRDHDPRKALDGGADGLDYYRLLAVNWIPRLRVGGRFMLEVGNGQASAVAALIGDHGGRVIEVLPDLNNVERIVVASPVIS
jgi:release factor glutamine methyltransferase